MIKISLIILAVAILTVLAYAASKPDAYTVTRSERINAPEDKLHAIINTPREFEKWSPYSPKDPQMTNTYSGPASGVGARNDFVGNSQVGQGSVEIIRSTAPSEVAMRLTMIKPFAAQNEVVYSLKPQAGSTEVTWAMHTKQPYFAKVIGVFINMDKMIGGDFAVGLSKLKVLAEKA
ncbi:SRPBCC family protein [Variovorax sp. PCZ-1]|uniref:SRPBCC family protein n=1 Tax=Variovorax sp. PCZ-1 TaxID=2835533 RepID=UPI001BCD16E3|nr:SRPBCC family protein [Variovorax sp. PCZ-1]MBS7807834.1 SRPBCC family protein [Variovorax sp. PCZ-1]